MESIKQDIKTGNFNKVYLLYGEEGYLRNTYKNQLVKAIIPESDSMNVTEFDGKEIDVNALMDTALTVPFFAEKRVVVVTDSNLFSTKQDELAEFLSDVPDTTVLIFSEEKPDKKYKLFKSCEKNGRVVEFKKFNENDPNDIKKLQNYILSILSKNKKSITYNAMSVFITRVGVSLDKVLVELEKLICYTLDKDSITEDDVKAVIPERLEDKIFEMIDCISRKNQKRALDLYYDLLRKKEAPVKILTLIERHYNQIYIFKNKCNSGCTWQETLQAAGIPSFRRNFDEYMKLAKSYSNNDLKDALTMCLDFDKAFKSGQIKDNIAVEMVIVKMSSRKTA